MKKKVRFQQVALAVALFGMLSLTACNRKYGCPYFSVDKIVKAAL